MHTPVRLFLLPTLLAAAAALVACAKQEPAPEPIRAVRTLTVAADSAGGSHDYAAELRARTESRLGFRVGGKIVSRPAEVGQKVRAGQLLAQLDPADLKLAQEAAAATLRSAQAAYDLALAEFKRYKDLRDQGFISALELERRETTLTAQRAQLDQAKANASVQGNQTGYSALTATAAGVVTQVDAEVGTVVAAGTPVLRLAHDGPRDAVFAVPEDSVAAVRTLLGKAGAIQIKPWGGGTKLPATVREVAAAADPATRTFLVKADVGTAALQLGQTLTASIELPRRDAAAKLPLAAVMQQQGQAAVWLLDRNTMTVKLQPVQVAGADGNLVVVASGLSPGQTVVTAGVHTLNPGQKVKLYDTPVPSAPTPAAPAASR
jgi:membrane fusion protein, multidrug efflux system